MRIKSLETSVSKFFTVTYTFHTSKHGDVSVPSRRYVAAGDYSLFDFSTVGRADIQSDETATGNFLVEEK